MEKGETHMSEQSLQVLNHQKKEELWAARISECRESGLGVQAWCAERGISHHTYYKWQQKLYHKYAEATNNQFYEINLNSGNNQAAVTVCLGQFRADVYNGADEHTIRAVMSALKSC